MKHNNRIFRVKTHLSNIKKAARGFTLLRYKKKQKIMNKRLKEHISLAVTAVNGCSLCSFVHTKVALSSGMSNEEISALLEQDMGNVRHEDAVALAFAQHYADSKENPDDDAIKRLIDEYGVEKAELIVAVCHMITMTNGMGISMHLFLERLKFKRDKRSNIFLEMLNPLLTMVLFPILAVYYFVKCRIKTLRLLPKSYLNYNN